jgi:oxalate---CoA ligase
VELRIVDHGQPVGGLLEAETGQSGHVEIRGPSVIAGYVGGAHWDRFDQEGWLRTGDLGHRDAEGYVYLDARTDDVINRGGEKIFPREVEEIIGADPMVTAAAVVGRDEPELGQVPVAYVVLRGPDDPTGGDSATFGLIARETASRIGTSLERQLVRSKRPVALCVVHTLPAGATGKVRRRSLGTAEVPVLYSFDLR